MNADHFYAVVRNKRLPDNVTDNTINDFINDYRISEDERLRRAQFINASNEGRALNVIVSRLAFFASTVFENIEYSTDNQKLQEAYHALAINEMVGDLALLANFTFSSFVDQKISRNFTITPQKRLVISTVVRALQMQSSVMVSSTKARQIALAL